MPRLFPSAVFWLQTVVLAVLCLLRDFAWKYVKRMYYPQTYHYIQEIQKYNIQDYRPRYVCSSPFLPSNTPNSLPFTPRIVSRHMMQASG